VSAAGLATPMPASDPIAAAQLTLGGPAALAESAWMGSPQASEVLEPLRLAAPSWRPAQMRLPSLRALLTRELSVAEASAVLMAAFFSSALLGAVRQALFNAQFGAGPEASAYYAAARLPEVLFSLVAGGALSSAMIPVLLGVTRAGGDVAGARLVRLILTALLALFALLTLAAELLAPWFVGAVLAPGFDPATQALTVDLTRILLLQPLMLVAGSVATAVLTSRNQFTLTALALLTHNLGVVGGVLLAGSLPGLGIYGPALGVLAGGALQLAILLPGLLARGYRLGLAWAPADRDLRAVGRLLAPNGLSVGVNYAGTILDTAFASLAPQAAGLAALTNAWMLAGLPIALLGQAVGQSAFPRLAAHAEAGEWQAYRQTITRALLAAALLALPALGGLLLLGRRAIAAIFERGRFDAAAGDLTFTLLAIYAVALPFYVATEVLTRGLTALRDTRTPLATNSAQIVGRAALLALLIPRLGVVAIPLAFALTSALETLVLLAALPLRLRRASQ
jgi:putative peptidoglycan lipid II flippase